MKGKQPHKLIARQLQKAGFSEPLEDLRLQKLVEMVADAYNGFDTDRQFLERAMEVTSREMVEKNLALFELAEKAQRIAKFKSDFLANMSHEIRTPINGMLGLTEMLREVTDNSAQLDLIDLLSRSAQSLVTVINDVLDISKIEAGKFSIVPYETELHELASDLGRLYGPPMREKNIEFICHFSPGIPQKILIDGGRLRQILTNLLGNAVKFTPFGGGVILFIEPVQYSNFPHAIRCSVADSGIGIPSGFLEKIFEAFNQVDVSATRSIGGTGLGLTITEKLVELMQGHIEVVSREGVGSLFSIYLPYQEIEVNHSAPAPVEETCLKPAFSRHNGRVLLAEDNAVNQKVAVHLLNRMGFSTEVACNGLEAVKLFAQGNFDLILMDCQMPQLSGFEATRQIRNTIAGARIPIIALTALSMDGDRERCLEAGMDDYIPKPIDKAQLAKTIEKLIPGQG